MNKKISDKVILELDKQVKVVITDMQALSLMSNMSNPEYTGNLGFEVSFDKLKIFNKWQLFWSFFFRFGRSRFSCGRLLK